MKLETVLLGKKISLWVMGGIVIIALIHMTISTLQIINNPATSFPWYSAIILLSFAYLIPLVLSVIAFMVFSNIAKYLNRS